MTRQSLKRYMEEFSLSQNELSRRSGVSQPTISNFLSGVSELNADNTEKKKNKPQITQIIRIFACYLQLFL